VPTISLPREERRTIFIIDTGTAPNLFKLNELELHIPVNSEHILSLIGITEGWIKTLGSVEANVLTRPVTFHVVPDNFPISQDRILESDFLYDAGKINFVEQTVDWHGAFFIY